MAVAVIGILAAALIPTLSTVRRSALNSKDVSNLRQIGVAFHLYRSDNQGEPPRPLEYYKSTLENRSVWGYGDARAVGLGRLQYNGYLDEGQAGVALLKEAKAKLFQSPIQGDTSYEGWRYDQSRYPDFIDYAYLISVNRWTNELDGNTAVATNVSGGDGQSATLPPIGTIANVLYADGAVGQVPFEVYSTPNRRASSFDRWHQSQP